MTGRGYDWGSYSRVAARHTSAPKACACSTVVLEVVGFFLSFLQTDVVHDALLSALGGRMSASAQDVQAYVALRRAPYGTDRVVMALAPDCTRTVKRLLYCSDRFRVVRKPGGSLLDGPRGTHEFQLARSGGSVPRTLSMQQLAFGQRRTPPPGNKRSGSRLSLPVEHPRKQKSASPAAPAVQQSRLDTAAIGMPPTTDPAPFPHLGDCHEMPPLSARTDSDAATSKVTAEFPEDKKAAGQPAFDGTCSARARTAKTETRGDAPPIDTSNVSPLDGLQAESSLADSLVGVGPLDFSADFHALLPPHIQGLPLMNEAEEDLSEQLLNFQEWETSFGWPCT